MPRPSFTVAAERLRHIAITLTNQEDEAAIKAYADELDALANWEVRCPQPLPLEGVQDGVGLGIFAGILKLAFPLDANASFDELLISIEEIT